MDLGDEHGLRPHHHPPHLHRGRDGVRRRRGVRRDGTLRGGAVRRHGTGRDPHGRQGLPTGPQRRDADPAGTPYAGTPGLLVTPILSHGAGLPRPLRLSRHRSVPTGKRLGGLHRPAQRDQWTPRSGAHGYLHVRLPRQLLRTVNAPSDVHQPDGPRDRAGGDPQRFGHEPLPRQLRPHGFVGARHGGADLAAAGLGIEGPCDPHVPPLLQRGHHLVRASAGEHRRQPRGRPRRQAPLVDGRGRSLDPSRLRGRHHGRTQLPQRVERGLERLPNQPHRPDPQRPHRQPV